MFNLLMSSNEEEWKDGDCSFPRDRYLEYTNEKIRTEHIELSTVIDKLKSYPTLFAIEGERKPTKIGYITDILLGNNKYINISFQINSNSLELEAGFFEKIKNKIDFQRFEINRTHWAIKDADIFKILLNGGYLYNKKSLENENRNTAWQSIDINNHMEITAQLNEITKTVRENNEVSDEARQLGLTIETCSKNITNQGGKVFKKSIKFVQEMLVRLLDILKKIGVHADIINSIADLIKKLSSLIL